MVAPAPVRSTFLRSGSLRGPTTAAACFQNASFPPGGRVAKRVERLEVDDVAAHRIDSDTRPREMSSFARAAHPAERTRTVSAPPESAPPLVQKLIIGSSQAGTLPIPPVPAIAAGRRAGTPTNKTESQCGSRSWPPPASKPERSIKQNFRKAEVPRAAGSPKAAPRKRNQRIALFKPAWRSDDGGSTTTFYGEPPGRAPLYACSCCTGLIRDRSRWCWPEKSAATSTRASRTSRLQSTAVPAGPPPFR